MIIHQTSVKTCEENDYTP